MKGGSWRTIDLHLSEEIQIRFRPMCFNQFVFGIKTTERPSFHEFESGERDPGVHNFQNSKGYLKMASIIMTILYMYENISLGESRIIN